MSIRKPRWPLAAAPAVVLAVTLTACGSGSDSDSEEKPAGDGGNAADEGSGGSSGNQNQDQDQSDNENENEDQASGGGGSVHGPTVELPLGEASGPVPYGDSWEFDATVERFEPGAWEDLEGSPAYEGEHAFLDPYYVEMTLTNESHTAYEGGHPSTDIHVRTDDGGPFETVEAMDAANLPEWCDYASPSASTTIGPGETVSECQVVLVGHGVGVVSLDWAAMVPVSWQPS
ncbi:hypothetical protein [Streptomyces sp. 6N223]|uniref:hypothetical protein n=1 Tax=Streptomyces sp. 6N223 TaxID=3457412 RepID=UPI003FD3D285